MKINERLYRSKIKDFREFYNFIFDIKNTGTQQQKQQISKIYYKIPNSFYGIPASTILHDNKKHNLKLQDWKDLINNLDSYEDFVESNKQQGFRGKNYLYKYYFEDEYFGVGIYNTKECNLVTTFFRDSEKAIDSWLRQNKTQREAPSTTNGHGSLLTEGLNNIITHLNKFVNLFEQKVYHGTNKQFKQFDPNFMNRMDYGYGFYFTINKSYAQSYGKYFLTCEIPDDEYLLHWDESYDYQPEHIQNCLDNLCSFFFKKDLDLYNKITDIVYGDLNTGYWIYMKISELLNLPGKELSELFYSFGIKGIYSFKGDCFVVFNKDDIKILKTDINENLNEDYKNKIFYHGSNYKFTDFDKSKIKENKLGLCFNFTDNYNIAYQYGNNIIKAHLDLNNPLTLDKWRDIFPYKWFNKFGKYITNDNDYEYDKKQYEKYPYTYGEMFNHHKMNPKFIKILQEMGYDGLAFPEDNHYGVFDPEQIHIIEDTNYKETFKMTINKNIMERFEEIESQIFATNSVYDVINILKNKPKSYRIVLDKKLNYYFIGDARNYIHLDLLEAAFRSGFYPEFYSEAEMQDYMDDALFNEDILLFAFYPTETHAQDIEKSSDGYTRKYVYDFGVIYAHEETPLEGSALYKKLGDPIKKENIFEDFNMKNNFKKLNEQLQKFLEEKQLFEIKVEQIPDRILSFDLEDVDNYGNRKGNYVQGLKLSDRITLRMKGMSNWDVPFAKIIDITENTIKILHPKYKQEQPDGIYEVNKEDIQISFGKEIRFFLTNGSEKWFAVLDVEKEYRQKLMEKDN